MKRLLRIASLAVAVLYLAPTLSLACSAFCLVDGDTAAVGRNFDWVGDYGLIFVNKRGIEKTAFHVDKPVKWESKYGSVSFNILGREFAIDGVNEAGLVLATLWLEDSQYEPADKRHAILNGQWVQYQLDTAATVKEVIASLATVRVEEFEHIAPIHFLLADKAGDVAIIEFIRGAVVYHTGDTMPVKAITNDTYADSVINLVWYEGFGGKKALPTSTSSPDRFVRVAAGANAYDAAAGAPPVDYAYDTLETVTYEAGTLYHYGTMWSWVMDMTDGVVYFQSRKNPKRRYFRPADFDYSSETPVTMLDVSAGDEGLITPGDFKAYDEAANRRIIRKTFDVMAYLTHVPDALPEEIAAYPATTKVAR
jgi:penicillin V acylase-like amidase (Ntn superfamily)